MATPTQVTLTEVAFMLSMVVAMVDKNRSRIKEEDADTFYLDRNVAWAKKMLKTLRADGVIES